MLTPVKRFFLRAAVLAAALLFALLILEFSARHIFREQPLFSPREVRETQAQLKLHPEVGYLWRENVRPNEGILLEWRDQDPWLLATDEAGFKNNPAAIRRRQDGERVNVIGLGDSYMHSAADVFYEIFSQRQLLYYSMAMPRHCPPQYTSILKAHALPERPDAVVYGIYENDFHETLDFLSWEQSGRDWFSYHSGTWFGPPANEDAFKRSLAGGMKGTRAFYRAFVQLLKARGLFAEEAKRPGLQEPSHARAVEQVRRSVLEAHAAAQAGGVQFLAMLIPGKTTLLEGRQGIQTLYYDALIETLEEKRVPYLDLRGRFERAKDKETLYYREDSHWNARGMREAADLLLKTLAQMSLPEGKAG